MFTILIIIINYFFNYTVKKNLDTELCIHIDLFLQKLYQFVQRSGGKLFSSANGQIVIIFIIINNIILLNKKKKLQFLEFKLK